MAGPRLAGSPRRRAGNPAVPARHVPADAATAIRRGWPHWPAMPAGSPPPSRPSVSTRCWPRLKTASAAAPGEPRLAAMHAVVRGQAHHLRGREAAADPGFVPRQLCLQATELGETLLAADCRTRQLASDDPGPVLQWTTRRTSPALILELGRHDDGVQAVAVLPDGRVVTGGGGGRVLVWDPAEPGDRPGRARPRTTRGGGGGGAAGRAGGHRRRRRAGAGVGPGRAGRRPGRARPPRRLGGGGGGAAGRAGGHRRRATGGCWCGTRRSRAPARSSSAATTDG